MSESNNEQLIVVEDNGTEFSVRLTGDAYRAMRKAVDENPALAGDPEKMAAVTLLAAATALTRKLAGVQDEDVWG